MADEVQTPAVTPDASVSPAAETPTAESKTETLSAAESMLEDVRAEEAKLNGKPEEKPKEPAKAEEPKGEDEDEEEAEPEGLTEADRNRAAWNKKLRDDALRASSEAATKQKELEAREAAVAAKEAELAGKAPKTETPREGTPASSELEHFKPITLAAYDDGDNPNEQALKTGIEGLAKDLLGLKTLVTTRDEEITRLKADNERLMKMAEPYIPKEELGGVSPIVVQQSAITVQGNVEKAIETLQGQYGPDSGLKLDPVTMLAAFREFAPGFQQIGELKEDTFFATESFIKCFEHAYKTDIDAVKAGAGKQEVKPKAPPLGEGGGKAKPPAKEEDLSDAERMLRDYKAEESRLSGARR